MGQSHCWLLSLHPGDKPQEECELETKYFLLLQSVSQSHLLVGQNLRVLLVLPNLLDDVERLHDLLIRELRNDGVPVVVLVVLIFFNGARPEVIV